VFYTCFLIYFTIKASEFWARFCKVIYETEKQKRLISSQAPFFYISAVIPAFRGGVLCVCVVLKVLFIVRDSQ